MADFFFFTDLNLIEDFVDGVSGQTIDDHFGKQENNVSGKDRFQVSSVFKRKSGTTDKIYAYAVCEGLQ